MSDNKWICNACKNFVKESEIYGHHVVCQAGFCVRERKAKKKECRDYLPIDNNQSMC